MKNVPIKFRGRFWLKDDYVDVVPKDEELVYGGYARMNFIADDGEGDYIINNGGKAYLIYPDSVAQLVGYDADGNEVYEGDKLKFCGNPESYRYVQAYDEARITAGLESSDLPLSEYKLTSEDEFYNWQYNIHTDDYE